LTSVPQEKRQRQKAGRQQRQEQIRAAQARRRRRTQAIVIAVVVAMIGLIAFVTSRGGGHKTNVAADKTTSSTAASQKAVDPTCPKPDGSSSRHTNFKKAPGMCIDPAKTYTATMKTNKGTIEIAFDAKKAPKTVNNFVFLARYHFFDGLTFHRVVPGFVIQGGDPKGDGTGGPGYQFADELPQPGDYKAGSLAMANSGANTNGSQFFIITSDAGAKQLVQAVGGQAKYSLFGQVTAGMDVVKAIEALGTGDGPPKEPVIIQSVTIKEA
jgi:cyclophilin family peptidyl-prolyl cis-trans isomerase